MSSMTTGRTIGLSAAAVLFSLTSGASAQKVWEGEGVLQRGDPHDWTLQVNVSLRAYPERDPSGHMPDMAQPFQFTSAAVVFPLIDSTSSCQIKPPPESTGVLSLNAQPSDTQPELLTDYPCGTRLGKWTLRDWTGQQVDLQVTLKETCWRTRLDEAAAKKLGWPEGAWTGIAATCFTPEYGVEIAPGEDPKTAEEHMQVVKDLVLQKWLNGKDPKSVAPVTLAKVLDGEVARLVQVSGNGLTYTITGEVSGVQLQGAAQTATTRHGSEFDMVGLLAAAYRIAGLPARTVIGWDVGQSKRDHSKFLGKTGSGELRAWVEFALADPAAPGGLTWVPVDVVSLRKSSSRTPAIDRPWTGFGSIDDLDGVLPFAFQFHPPTTVVAQGSPAFYGWLVTPKPPDKAVQAIRFLAMTTPKTAEQQQQKDKQEHHKKSPYGH